MASSLFALLDDIATLLDDVAVMAKVATKKTAGVLGDDLALNAEQVTGVKPDRELPVVWAVAKGSLKNKGILVPGALLISAFASWLIVPLLMLGGAFLCYEGFEKVAHRLLHSKQEDLARKQEVLQAVADPAVDMVAFEKKKIEGAIRTDFILSAEVIVITLGTATAASFGMQVALLIAISLLITVGVYGLVAAIVKLDDVGLYLSQRDNAVSGAFGRGILFTAPYLLKLLSIAGTTAMFLVGGGILIHGVPPLEHAIARWTQGLGGAEAIAQMLASGIIGVLAGALVLALVKLGGKIWSGVRGKPA
jgi:predicted DNA repair protein MutK